MKQKRALQAVCFRNDKIYAIGGAEDYDSGLDCLECYDFGTKKWEHFPRAMKTKRYGHQACVRDGMIIAFGGNDGEKALDTIECF